MNCIMARASLSKLNPLNYDSGNLHMYVDELSINMNLAARLKKIRVWWMRGIVKRGKLHITIDPYGMGREKYVLNILNF